MKVKALRRKDTGEYGHIYGGSIFTSEIPQLLPYSCDFNVLIELKENININFDNYELIELEIYNVGELGADIRNNLSSIKNLISLIKSKHNVTDENKIFNVFQSLIDKEISQCEIFVGIIVTFYYKDRIINFNI